MGTIVDVTDAEWDQVEDLFDPDGRRGAPDLFPRRLMVEAMLWMARTGVQWRYLPEQFPPWTAVWSQWRRWRSNGVWAQAMGRFARTIRMDKERHPEPSMLMVDAQTAKGGRAGPTFHAASEGEHLECGERREGGRAHHRGTVAVGRVGRLRGEVGTKDRDLLVCRPAIR